MKYRKPVTHRGRRVESYYFNFRLKAIQTGNDIFKGLELGLVKSNNQHRFDILEEIEHVRSKASSTSRFKEEEISRRR